MRAVKINGTVTGQVHEGFATGEVVNGAEVVAFTERQMFALIEAGDGADANGYGLLVCAAEVLDVHGPGQVEAVPTITARIDGCDVALYVPAGRIWDLVDPNSTNTVSQYDPDDRCRACGEHVADPHAPTCPAERAGSLREDAAANEQAHQAAVAGGGYTDGCPSSPSVGGSPAQVTHRFVAITQRLAADLVEMDHHGAIDLAAWPAAAAFLAHVEGRGEVDQG